MIDPQFRFNQCNGFREEHISLSSPYGHVFHWMVLYKLYVFCSDMKFKMAATAGLSLTFDPMGKMFQNASWNKKHTVCRGPSNEHSCTVWL
jgi:hypothetical protein